MGNCIAVTICLIDRGLLFLDNASVFSSARRVLGVFFLLLAMLGCGPRPDALSKLSASFRKNHDFQSLNSLAGHLKLGMPRAEVERMLGDPDYSPIEGQFYYASKDRKTGKGTPVGLIVEYRRTNPKTGEVVETGRLESLYLGPIGE